MKINFLKFLSIIFFATNLYAIDVKIPDVSSPAEKSFTVGVQTSSLSGQNIFSVDMKIIFDASILSVTGVSSSGTLLSGWGNPTFNIGSDNVRISAGGTTALSGEGTLVKIRFKVANSATVGSNSPIAFASFQFNEGTPTATLTNGTLTVIQDTEPPVLTSGPNAESTTSHSTTISWRTDEPANSVVEFGTTSGYGETKYSDQLKTNHSITLTGLKASTTYHYRVASTDKLNNGPTRSSDNTFTTSDIIVSLPDKALDPGSTLLIPVSVSDVSEQEVTSVNMTIHFDADILSATSVATDGTIAAAWPSPTYSVSPGQIQVSMAGTTALNGSGLLLKLQVHVEDNARVGEQSPLEFSSLLLNSGVPPVVTRNGSFTVKDTQPPEITFGPEAANITSTSAEIIWTTNENSTSKVEFGKTTAYGHVEVSSSRVVEHKISLSGLDPATVYHFKISSSDSSGNGPTTSEDFTFQTNPGGDLQIEIPNQTTSVGETITIPVQTSDLSGAGILSYNAVFQYDRDLMEFQRVENGRVASSWPNLYFDSVDGQVLVSNSGSTELTSQGVLCNLVFTVKNDIFNTDTDIRCAQFFFNSGWPEVTTQSGKISITGNPDIQFPQFVFGPIVDQISTNSARVIWQTDEPANGEINFGQSASYGEKIDIRELSTFHSIELDGLATGSSYHLQVNGYDEAGNGPTTSENISFQTLVENGVAVSLPTLLQPAGNNFQLSLNSGNLSGLQVYSAYIVLSFDESILTATSATSSGTLTSGWGNPVYTITPGRIVIAMGGVSALNNSGSLVKINFSLNSSVAEGTQTPISFEQFTFNEGTPAAVLTTGLVTIKDTIDPVIEKGPIVFGISPNSATILWATNEPTTARLQYGPTSSYGEEKQSGQLATGHMMVLSGLEENSQYHYRISSSDASGNGPAQSGDMVFTTSGGQIVSLSIPNVAESPGSNLNIPIAISDVTGQGITSLHFDLSFDDQLLQINSVETVGSLTESWNSPAFNSNDGVLSVSFDGSSALSGSGTLVYIQFNILENAGIGSQSNLELSNVLFNGFPGNVETTNGKLTIKDDSPPQITNGPFASAITSSSAEIVWFTDEPANSSVHYGPTPDYGNEKTNETFVTEHRVVLDALAISTTYHYKVACSDSFGNGPTTSANFQFTSLGTGTPVKLALADTTIAENSEFRIPVILENEESEGLLSISFELVYDPAIIQLTGLFVGNSLSQSWDNRRFTRNESSIKVELSGSTPLSTRGTLIYITGNVNETSLAGANSSLILANLLLNNGELPIVGQNGSVRIIDTTMPEFAQQPNVVDAIFNAAIVEWETNELTTGYIEFGTSESYGSKVNSDTLALFHQITLPDLTANTIYNLRAGISDSSNNGPVLSSNFTLTTPSPNINLTIPDSSASPTQNLLLPLQISRVDGHDITTFELTIQYDPDVIAARGATNQNCLTESWRQPSFSDEGGTVQISMQGDSTLSGQGNLVYLSFQIAANAIVGAATEITIASTNFNNGAVEITDIQSSTISIKPGDPENNVLVAIPDTTSVVGESINLPILVDSLNNKGITSFQFKVDFDPEVVAISGVDTTGALSSGRLLEETITEISYSCEMSGTTALEGVGTLLYLQTEILNQAVHRSAEINFDYFTFNLGFPPAKTVNGTITISQRKDIISGFVFERETELPIDSAIVQLSPSDSLALSDSSGFFIFSNLDSTESYNLTVTKNGFVDFVATEPVQPGTSNLLLYLEAKNGFIEGTIKNESGEPIAKALIIADDSHGNFGSANSDSTGFFRIGTLAKSNPYFLRVSKYGYFEQTLENVAINSNLNITLKENFGKISGTVKYSDNTPASNVHVQLADISDPLASQTAATGNSGEFLFNKVRAGEYVLTVQHPGYMSEPEQYTFNLAPGQEFKADFVIEEAVLHSLSIQVNDELSNATESNIYYLALTESGRKMTIANPQWIVMPEKAGTITNGIFQPNNSFIGKTTVIILESTSQLSDTVETEIFAPVGPETIASFSNEENVKLHIPAGSFRDPQKLKISSVVLPPFKQNAKSATAVGSGIQLKPDEYDLELPITIEVPHNSATDDGQVIGRWNKETANWIAAEDNYFDAGKNQLSASVSSLGLFSVLFQSKALGIEQIKFYPNPFSPDMDTDNDGEPGLSILLKMSSQSSRTPFVTIKIYNMLGELVRTLVERDPFVKDTENIIRWNGRTDDNRLARNGRYVIHTEIEDAGGKTENISTVVLIR